MTVESKRGVHSKERLQTVAGTKGKTQAEQYAEFHNIDYSKCASKKVEDVGRGRVTVLEE